MTNTLILNPFISLRMTVNDQHCCRAEKTSTYITSKSTFCQTALSCHTVNVYIGVVVIWTTVVWSFVSKRLNGSLAEPKANVYYYEWLLTHGGLRWSNWCLFPFCHTVNSACQPCVYEHRDLWTKHMLNQHTHTKKKKRLQDCYCVEAHLSPIWARV